MDENKNANVYIATMANSSQPRKRSRKGAPGILDVASRAGVSAATVSRCFNDPKVVRPDTRKRIEEAAEALGYIRDRVAGSLHNRMSGSVGLVVPTIDDAIFSELIEAFSAELHLHDRTMLIASHNYNLDREVTIIRSLLERRIDAVAIVGRDHSRVALEMLKVREIPVVSLWNASGAGEIPIENRGLSKHCPPLASPYVRRGISIAPMMVPSRSLLRSTCLPTNDRLPSFAATMLLPTECCMQPPRQKYRFLMICRSQVLAISKVQR